MAGFRLRAFAKRDLFAIAAFTERHWGKKQRNAYLKQLDDSFRQLGSNSKIGSKCDYVRPGYRKFPTGSHVIFYRLEKDGVEIIRVLHKSMDVTSAPFEA